jgi:hypothetical protein
MMRRTCMPSSSPTAGTRGALSHRFLALWGGSVLSFGLLLFTYRYLEHSAARDPIDFREPLINELSAALGGGLLFFAWRAVLARAPLARTTWRRHTPLYLAVWLAGSVAHTSWNWLLRSLLYPLAGLGAFDYGRMSVRYWMELPADTILSIAMIAGLTVAERVRAARAAELAQERLEARLGAARLEALRLRLQPHFLFNALHAISATMYTDVEAADRMLEHLANLLRASLRAGEGAGERVTLATEFALLEDYLALVRVRFEGRLECELEVAPELGDPLVPALLLQPLVENSVRHGGVEERGTGRVHVRAARVGDELELVVEDDGPGPGAAGDSEDGHGLGLTRERLRLHFGTAGRLTTERGAMGGFLVRLRLPFRRASEERGTACAS